MSRDLFDTKRVLIHPVRLIMRDMARSLISMGLEPSYGELVVTEEQNFDWLNIGPDHPARDEHDTFFLTNGKILRTQTSSHQVDYLRENKHRLEHGTIGMFSMGEVFRYEATDATHDVQFHQCEGVVVGRNVSFANLKRTLTQLIKDVIGASDEDVRFRPGYFPFVEPGVEVDMRFNRKWQEVLGAGMIHPNVLRNAGIDPEEYGGFAFGAGVERFAMIKFNIDDLRLFTSGDLRLNFNIIRK